jgi:hypothetical protein
VRKARKIEASVASVASVIVVGPSIAMPLSVLWVVAVVGHHYPTHQNHWGY